MGVTDLFGSSFEVLRKYPRLVLPQLVFALVLSAVVTLLVGPLPKSAQGRLLASAVTVGLIVQFAIILVAALLIGLFLTAFYLSIGDQSGSGCAISVGDAVSNAKSKYVRLFLAELVVGIVAAVVFGIIILGVVAIIASSASGGVSGSSALLLAAFIGVVFLLVIAVLEIFIYMVSANVVVGGSAPLAAISASISFGKSNALLVLGIVLLAVVISLVFSLVESPIIFAVAYVVPGATVSKWLGVLLGAVVGGILGAWFTMIPALVYRAYAQPQTAPQKQMPSQAARPSQAAKPKGKRKG